MNYTIAQTIPEEDRENYITEDEAKEMIKVFNNHLRSLSFQTGELINSNENLVKKIERETERNNFLKSSIMETKQNIKLTESEIENKSSILSNLDTKTYSKCTNFFPSNEFIIPNSISFDRDSNISESEMKYINSILAYLLQLENTFIILQTQKELLRKNLEEKQDCYNTLETCVMCKEKYIRSKNHNNACDYHPGKLKYFSCRGCGVDAYYDCCIKCKSCSKGCKTSHHTS
ncbi:hypothetical protein SteCoe_9938 [Stentor coeruleus]|uniref:Uncharacterized protein n=1 Tax=Stentor coeruleus TaxID=5963 RepID=A0A1R2CGS9_9CILI|nr:hypothetical protein SteCoe_9938 [Stentor coeruleus]